jgi:hypothetical protein
MHVRASDVMYTPGCVVLSTGHWRKRLLMPELPTGHSGTVELAVKHGLKVDHESKEQSTSAMLTCGSVTTEATVVVNDGANRTDSDSLVISAGLDVE